MGKDRKPLGTLAVVALAAILLSAVALAVDVDAARGGRGGNGGGGTPTITVSPNPAPLGSTSVVISGSGFRANETLDVVGPLGTLRPSSAVADGNGNFSITWVAYDGEFNMAGSGLVVAAKFKGQGLAYLATTTLTICSTNPC